MSVSRQSQFTGGGGGGVLAYALMVARKNKTNKKNLFKNLVI
jgi:hypothetical protein